MKVITFSPTKLIDDAFYLPSIDTLFISSKITNQERQDIIDFYNKMEISGNV